MSPWRELLQIIPANSTLAAEVQPEAPTAEEAWLAEQAAEPGVTRTAGDGAMWLLGHREAIVSPRYGSGTLKGTP